LAEGVTRHLGASELADYAIATSGLEAGIVPTLWGRLTKISRKVRPTERSTRCKFLKTSCKRERPSCDRTIHYHLSQVRPSDMEHMPMDACQFFYDCKGCGERLKPLSRRLLRFLFLRDSSMPTDAAGPAPLQCVS